MGFLSLRRLVAVASSLLLLSSSVVVGCGDAAPLRAAAGSPDELVPVWLAGEERGALIAALTADGSLLDELKAALRSDAAFKSELAASIAEDVDLSSQRDALAGALKADANFRDELAAAIAPKLVQPSLPGPCEEGGALRWSGQAWGCAPAEHFVEVEGDSMSGPLEVASAAPGSVIKASGGQELPPNESVLAMTLADNRLPGFVGEDVTKRTVDLGFAALHGNGDEVQVARLRALKPNTTSSTGAFEIATLNGAEGMRTELAVSQDHFFSALGDVYEFRGPPPMTLKVEVPTAGLLIVMQSASTQDRTVGMYSFVTGPSGVAKIRPFLTSAGLSVDTVPDKGAAIEVVTEGGWGTGLGGQKVSNAYTPTIVGDTITITSSTWGGESKFAGIIARVVVLDSPGNSPVTKE